MLQAGTPVYIESLTLIRTFSSKFFPGRTLKDKHGFKFISEIDGTRKVLQGVLRALRIKGLISKKALGVYNSKVDFILPRGWVWAWMLTKKGKTIKV